MKAAEVLARDAATMTEAQLQTQVVALARALRWRWFHVHDSRRSPAGFPDLILVRGPRLIAAELKRQKGRYRPGQQEWLADLDQVPGVTAVTWRPTDLLDGTIQEALR